MKDEDKIRERVELLLDNRQIFLIFMASAVILALVFSLGVVVGKRSNPTPASLPPTDPLALLDKMSKGESVDDNLTFHSTLTNEAEPVKLGGDVVDTTPASVTPGNPDPAAREAKKGEAATVKAKAEAEKKAAEKKAAEKKAAEKKAAEKKAAEKKAKKEGNKEPGDGDDKAKKDTFSLQLSAFQERHEAEQFMLKLKQSGLKPYLVTTSIPGRGIWYRVRVGNYLTWEEALAAKENFEQRHKIIAYVTRK